MLRVLSLIAFLMPGLLSAQQVERQPAYLLQVPSSVPAIFIAETDTSTLHRFSSVSIDGFNRDERYMSVGQNGVGKEKPWDRRTPLGLYFVTEQLDTSKLHEKYGPLAFPLDYPNAWDRANERSGDGIWIHGVSPDGGRRPPFDTDGCIALPNEELLALEKQFIPLTTPVIVTRAIQWVSAADAALLRNELNDALDAWALSQRDGDLHRYFSLYETNFAYRGLDRNTWSSFRTQTLSVPIQEFEIADVLLLADPEETGLYLSRFHQRVIRDDSVIETIKRLYWHRNAQGELRIVAEDNG